MPARFRAFLCTAFLCTALSCTSLLTAAGTAHASAAEPAPGTTVVDRPEGDNGWW